MTMRSRCFRLQLVLIFVLILSATVTCVGAATVDTKLFRFSLAKATVRGQPILGRTTAAVVSALGRPDQRALGKRYGSLRYGRLSSAGWAVTVTFRGRSGVLRAVSLAIASPVAEETRLGPILRLSPKQIQSKISRGYADTFRLTEAYRCRRRPIRCAGGFASVAGQTKLSFGLLFPRSNAQRYVVIYE
jgi:hypothetical protein